MLRKERKQRKERKERKVVFLIHTLSNFVRLCHIDFRVKRCRLFM